MSGAAALIETLRALAAEGCSVAEIASMTGYPARMLRRIMALKRIAIVPRSW